MQGNNSFYTNLYETALKKPVFHTKDDLVAILMDAGLPSKSILDKVRAEAFLNVLVYDNIKVPLCNQNGGTKYAELRVENTGLAYTLTSTEKFTSNEDDLDLGLYRGLLINSGLPKKADHPSSDSVVVDIPLKGVGRGIFRLAEKYEGQLFTKEDLVRHFDEAGILPAAGLMQNCKTKKLFIRAQRGVCYADYDRVHCEGSISKALLIQENKMYRWKIKHDTYVPPLI